MEIDSFIATWSIRDLKITFYGSTSIINKGLPVCELLQITSDTLPVIPLFNNKQSKLESLSNYNFFDTHCCHKPLANSEHRFMAHAALCITRPYVEFFGKETSNYPGLSPWLNKTLAMLMYKYCSDAVFSK